MTVCLMDRMDQTYNEALMQPVKWDGKIMWFWKYEIVCIQNEE